MTVNCETCAKIARLNIAVPGTLYGRCMTCDTQLVAKAASYDLAGPRIAKLEAKIAKLIEVLKLGIEDTPCADGYEPDCYNCEAWKAINGEA